MEVKAKCDKYGPCFGQHNHAVSEQKYYLTEDGCCGFCGADLSIIWLEVVDMEELTLAY